MLSNFYVNTTHLNKSYSKCQGLYRPWQNTVKYSNWQAVKRIKITWTLIPVAQA